MWSPLQWQDPTAPHLITRGNVDGILAASAVLHQNPLTTIQFVSSSTGAAEALRRCTAPNLILTDLGLTPKLVQALNAYDGQVLFVDHHQQSFSGVEALGENITPVLGSDGSATSVLIRHLGLSRLGHLAAVADIADQCPGPYLDELLPVLGQQRLDREARILDFSWRFQVEDDRFRARAARALSGGAWPSEVSEIHRRFLGVLAEGRWERAQSRVREHIQMVQNVAVLDFGRRRPSLMGFGSRALTSVAIDLRADIAVLVNRRSRFSSIALRGFTPRVNLGLYAEEFTLEHGIVGGGHPTSAGARIRTGMVPQFVGQLVAMVA